MEQSRNPNKIRIHPVRVSRYDYIVAVEICRPLSYTPLCNTLLWWIVLEWSHRTCATRTLIFMGSATAVGIIRRHIYVFNAANFVFKHISATVGGIWNIRRVEYLFTLPWSLLSYKQCHLSGPNCALECYQPANVRRHDFHTTHSLCPYSNQPWFF